MKVLTALLTTVLLALSPGSFATETPEAIATRLLDHLDAARYAQAEAMFSPEMKAAVPAEKLKAVWESLPAQQGAPGKRGQASSREQGATHLVRVPLDYIKSKLQAVVAVGAQGKVVGFLIQSPPAPPADAPAADANFSEVDFNLPAHGEAKAALPGTLALPKGAGPFPAVVLVHGSGPQDRDETIGPNRPFLDIARGLAAQGIAVLRYEKRTKAHPQEFAGNFSIDDETTDDAAAAVAALAADARINAKQIYLFGHSQGGLLAGRIANRASGQLAGLILFAAPARPLLDLLREQNHYLLGLDGSISAEEQNHLYTLDASIAAVRKDADAKLMTLPGSFWQALEAVDPVADVKASTLPALVLQGGRDFQVIDADWQRWRQGLKGERYRFHHYPALNHLGIAGQGQGSLDEYQTPGHVDAQLINDVAAWIKR